MPNQINVTDFDLAATLECGQAFRWSRAADDQFGESGRGLPPRSGPETAAENRSHSGWFVGVVGPEVWRLRQTDSVVEWHCCSDDDTRRPRAVLQLQHYLSLDRSLRDIVATFPDDPPLRAAVRRHWGLRILRQDPWETLASFIASSTKQIVQIRQIVGHLARQFGEPVGRRPTRCIADSRNVTVASPSRPATPPPDFYAFPTPTAVARASLSQLAECKLGFRARYLLAAARAVDSGALDFAALPRMELARAQEELCRLPGVGEKIANCVLLFGCGFHDAFPIDVWMERALRRLYFPDRYVTARQLRAFAAGHFGPHAGWAQQYLFCQEWMRGRRMRPASSQTAP
jgi:N-glycosylase/DNA lyase